MADAPDRVTNDVMSMLGRHWGLVLVFGVLSVITGILVAVWPHISLLVAAVLLGIQLVINGVFRFISAFAAPAAHAWARVLSVIIAVLSLIAGIYLLRHPFFSVAVLGIVLGMYWIVAGVTDLFTAISYRELPGRWTVAIMGVLGLIAGIIVISSPFSTLLFIAIVLGIWLIIFGCITIFRAFMMMRGGRSPVRQPAGAT